MHIEIRDPSLVERLRRLLPRPDAPFDDVILMLLEQPCKLKTKEVVEEAVSSVEERMARHVGEAVAKAIEEALTNSLGDLTRKMAQVVDKAVKEAMKEIQGIEIGGGWDMVIKEAQKRPDGCLTFAEVRKYYGKNLNSVMLRQKGFVQKERGLWCLPKKA